MNKITTINLNGRAYQLEEGAYEILKRYLDRAQKQLDKDPDEAEVIQDFEQAIAEKCDQVLNKNKNVVTKSEMESIIDEMGPVEVANEDDSEPSEEAGSAPKRFYTLRDGALLGGVCTGLAAYFNVDVTAIRLLFIILTLVSGGIWILVYFLILILAPEAKTPEQKAELRGERYTAKDLLARAKQKYNDMGGSDQLKVTAKRATPALSNVGVIVILVTRIFAGITAAFFSLFIAIVTVGMSIALWNTTRGHLGVSDQLASVANWEWTLLVVVTYIIVAVPSIFATRVLMQIATRRFASRQMLMRWIFIGGSSWIIAVAVGLFLGVALRGPINDYVNNHNGYLDIHGKHICMDSSMCNTNQNTPIIWSCNQPYPGTGVRPLYIRSCALQQPPQLN